MTNKLLSVDFEPFPKGGQRFKKEGDKNIILDTKTGYSLYDDKALYPSIFENVFVVKVTTLYFYFEFKVCGKRIYANKDLRYRWNNADIVGILKMFCSPDDRRIILPSGIHDYMLEFKKNIYSKISDICTPDEYRRITSEIFIYLCIQQGFSPLKAKIMGNLVDCFQKHFQKKKWNVLKEKSHERG